MATLVLVVNNIAKEIIKSSKILDSDLLKADQKLRVVDNSVDSDVVPLAVFIVVSKKILFIYDYALYSGCAEEVKNHVIIVIRVEELVIRLNDFVSVSILDAVAGADFNEKPLEIRDADVSTHGKEGDVRKSTRCSKIKDNDFTIIVPNIFYSA